MSGFRGEPGPGDEPLLRAQSERLAPFRERLLRRITPGLRGATLDLACGSGGLARELAGRVRGPVIALDASASALASAGEAAPLRVRADASALPFGDASFDLVVTQCAWLWFARPRAVASEVRRVLAPGGVLLAVGEPDFGGATAWPESSSLAPTWESALRRAGANPRVGRELPGLLRAAGFARVEAEVFGIVGGPDDARDARATEEALLRGLGLTSEEERGVVEAREALGAAGEAALAFVPRWGLLAWR